MAEHASNSTDLSELLFQHIVDGDPDLAVGLLEQYASVHGYGKAVSDVMEPALAEVGRRWEQEKISLAAGYLAGKIAEDILTKALACDNAVPSGSGTAVIGNIEDDYHSLGRKLIGTFLKAAGWQVIDLGNDVTAKNFVDEAQSCGAHVIGVSAMMFSTAKNILEVRREIDERGLTDRIMLAVGGAVFKMRPELVSEVGGDGTAANAVDVPLLFENLRRRIRT